MKKLSQEEFINRSNQIHINLYDYSLVEYINVDTKVKIICPQHGIFEQRCDHHLNGKKCKKCSTNSKKHNINKNNSYLLFIKKSKEKWKNKYDFNFS
jgi:hypothetical protein